ncbi:heavy-metal-associated domain-containing protein [Desulfohalovibrio reitneri]|uniref:heavy-metal-associated domain-containing protein n=1 Tax=Desulfohalovibrio reitneri TaxID=1307759 RepID=UPI000A4763CA|nr:copper ion binding protein [Desulfohalovibrio reitneri]
MDITVKGMSCQHCVASVKEALGNLDGVASVDVDLESGRVRIEERSPVSPELVKKTIEGIGFEVTG